MNISNTTESVEDCERVAEIATKYGYDILCDDGIEDATIAASAKQEEDDPNCDKAIKSLTKFGYEVVCE